ncbi:MAG: hypothetical protein QOH35_34, partial [Acidobacteriaceae bacterium]|nr:hypothetical protein [Acidobacteriaceae bacterium]
MRTEYRGFVYNTPTPLSNTTSSTKSNE